MNVVLILSDVLTAQQRIKIIDAIDHYGEWIPLSRSNYAINTHLSAEELADRLQRHTGVHAGLQVIRVRSTYEGYAPLKVKEWLGDRRRFERRRLE
jgi:hypothetical protein